MTWGEITFTTFGGLRGAVSLILAQVVVTEQSPKSDLQNRKVTAQVSGLHIVRCIIIDHSACVSAGSAHAYPGGRRAGKHL